MGLMIESNARFVGREEIAQVPTPTGTASWKPVPHMEVIDAVGDVVNARGQFARMEPLHRHPQQP